MFKICLVYSILITLPVWLVQAQNLASDLKTLDICMGLSKTIDCTTTIKNEQSIVIAESFYGIQKTGSSSCGYNPGDCIQDVPINVCGYNKTVCKLQATSRLLNKCNAKSANYLRVEYYCVPFNHPKVKTFDICSQTVDITENNGFITSPNYPTFNAQNECTVKINVPPGKSINLWTVDMAINIRDTSGECKSNYVKITDNTGTYDLCGTEREAFYNTFCSNTLYVSYKAIAEPIANYKNRGFKLFFETFDVSSSSGCSTQTPGFPTSPSLITPTNPSPLISGQASLVYNFQVCKLGEPVEIDAPLYSLIYIESLTYGIPSSLTCEPYSSLHCLTPAAKTCNLQSSCTYNLGNVNIGSCGRKPAQYLYGTYRFIPISSPVKYSMCDITVLNGDSNKYGIITSRNYPTWEEYQDCTLLITSSNPLKAFKFYITEIDIEDPDYYTDKCEDSYLGLSDGITSEKHCGHTSYLDSHSYSTCSNNLTITYKTSAKFFLSNYLRGFRSYYEIIDRPSNCPTQTTTTLKTLTPIQTTPSQTQTTPDPNAEVLSFVYATNSSGSFQRCVFPFKYKNTIYNSCINIDQPNYWCSLTDNFDRDNQRGTCSLGLTSNQQFQVCSDNFRKFSCPAGYVIHIVSAEYAVTSDGSCDYSKKKCSTSAVTVVSSLCAGLNYCSFYGPISRIQSCSNAFINVVHIDYRCIPESVDFLSTTEFCSSNNILADNQGLIQTPKYPAFQNNLSCALKYVSNEKKLISIYAIAVNLQSAIGQPCASYYVQVNDGTKFCGIKKSILIHQLCSNNFQVNFLSGPLTYKGVKLFYETRTVTDESVCPVTEMPTSSPLSTASTTQPAVQPIWVQQGISSPIITKNLCLVGGTFECPANYVITIRKTFYGISHDQNCFYDEKDCVSYEEIADLNCAGKRSCYVPYTKKRLPECEFRNSDYIQIEYDCIPENPSKTSLCSGKIITQSKGGLINPSYPNFDANLDCTANIQVKSNSLIKVYIKDLDLDCSFESLTFNSPNSPVQTLCGQLSSVFAFETCSNTLNVNLKTKQSDASKGGVSIYYEETPKPFDFECDQVTKVTTMRPTTTTTTKLVTTVTKPIYFGFASPLQSMIGCTKSSIYCPNDYIIVIQSSDYGVSKNSDRFCSYDQNDCFASFKTPVTNCAGNQNCSIAFSPSSTVVADCERKLASYFYVTYQCIPTLSVGRPEQPNIGLCSPDSTSNQYNVATRSSAIFQSINFPTYPNVSINCSAKISIETGNHLKVYLNTARFRGSNTPNCSQNTDFVQITDGFETFKYCGNSFYSVFMMQSRSNWITVEYFTSPLTFVAPFYKGFQIYVEAYTDQVTEVPVSTSPTPLPTTVTYQPGFASPYYHDEICSKSSKTITCPDNYIILVHQEHLVNTNGYGCSHSSSECSQPTDMLLNDCSGKQTCSVYFPETEIVRCSSKYADLLDFEYQCIPANPMNDVKVYTCKDDSVRDVLNGFIQSTDYPQSIYDTDCEFKLNPPINYGIKFYFIDLSLKNIDGNNCNLDFVSIDQNSFCVSSQAKYAYFSNDSNTVSVRYKSPTKAQAGQDVTSRGFKLYFEVYSLIPSTTLRSTTQEIHFTAIRNRDRSSDLFNISMGLGIPILLVLIALIFLTLKMNSASFPGFQTRINFSTKDNNKLSSFANPNAVFN